MKGSYLLVLQLEQPAPAVVVGRLGRYDFAPGFYLYVGSAFGSGGLEARIAYHRRPEKARPRWHVDYLRRLARLREAWAVAAPARLECVWCRALAGAPGVTAPVPRFGSRDTGCPSHLFFLPRAPHPGLLTRVVLGSLDDDAPAELLIEIYNFDEE